MGLKGDFDEVAKVWRASPWRIKVWLILSAVLASNSIATLSDTFFRWKLFIKEGLSFYQSFVSTPVQTVIAHLLPNTRIPPGVPHLLVLSALYIGANIRIAMLALPRSKARETALRSTASYLGGCGGMLIGLHLSGKLLEAGSALGFFIGAALGASISYLGQRGAARFLWFVHLGLPFAIVGLLAAVNSGLTRAQ